MSQNEILNKNPVNKKKVAVFFGGRSPEHDVSVITGLQVLQAINHNLFDAFPVYVSPDGSWYIGDLLRDRKNYLLDDANLKQVTEVTLDVSSKRGGALIPKKSPFIGSAKPIKFDIAMPAFHGLFGEDGGFQGLFELANIPYVGMRSKASSVLMDKVTTKYLLKALDIPALPFAVLRRPDEGYLIPESVLGDLLKDIDFPCIIKPSHLGSSIGVAKANNIEEVKACLPAIFEYDDTAIVEPFVQNLVEYNVAVFNVGGKVITSAIERPKTSKELLDFKEKYASDSNNKNGNKTSGNKTFSPASEGMLSLTRDINPDIPSDMENDIRKWAIDMFTAIDGTGAPRIDFIGDSKSGRIWMNEVNPCPGSFGYFLWEALKEQPIFFTDFLSKLISEAMLENTARALPYDPVPAGARLLSRKG